MTESMTQNQGTNNQDDTNQDPDGSIRRSRLLNIANSLLKKRDVAVLHRASTGVEQRWREDEDAVIGDLGGKGDSVVDLASGLGQPKGGKKEPVRSKAIINVIRGKVEVGVGRFSDIMLPSTERNWGFEVTPVPELVKAMGDDREVIDTTTNEPMLNPDGTPVRALDIARVQVDKAEEKMKAMQTEVDDQLTECGFVGESLKVINDAAAIGTGIIKGPAPRKSVRSAWVSEPTADNQDNWIMKTVEEQKPTSRHVDYHNVFPDPNCGDDVRRASYMWEIDPNFKSSDLRALIGVEGYFDEQIEFVLLERPQRTSIGTNVYSKNPELQKKYLTSQDAYELWEYNGEVGRDDLEALGIDTAGLGGKSLSACVIFVNERPIKIVLNILDNGDLPYDFFTWTAVKGSPWGIGIARQAHWWQRIIQSGWRIMLDNARDSSGANVIIGSGIEPYDGDYEMTGKKLWKAKLNTVVTDIKKVFGQFQLVNNQVEIQALIDLAMKFLDIETGIPMLFQGEQSESIPDVLGIVDVIVDSSNVAMRSRVRIYDERLTKPHIRRYYDYNMQYSEKMEIKGDYNVKALGSSVLIAKDKNLRALIETGKLREDPAVNRKVDWDKWTEELFSNLGLNVLKSDADIKRDDEARKDQPQGQQGDPRVMAAQIRGETDIQKAQLNQQADMAELQLKAQMAERDLLFKYQIAEMEMNVKMMELAETGRMKLDEIKKELTIEASKENLMLKLADMEARTAELTTPPVEPPGKAKEGQAFQA